MNAISSPITHARPVSPLSLAQWKRLELLANIAQKSATELSHALLMQASELNRNDGDAETIDRLMALAKRVEDARQSMPLVYDLHCQPEWTGGDSSDPANHVLREPHLMGMRRLTVRE